MWYLLLLWVLESPWICVWRSFKVREFDFLKHRDRTSWYWKRCSRWLLSDLNVHKIHFRPGSFRRLYMLIKVPVWFNLVILIYPLYGPWKSLKSPWMWFWQMVKNPGYLHRINLSISTKHDAVKLILISTVCVCEGLVTMVILRSWQRFSLTACFSLHSGPTIYFPRATSNYWFTTEISEDLWWYFKKHVILM